MGSGVSEWVVMRGRGDLFVFSPSAVSAPCGSKSVCCGFAAKVRIIIDRMRILVQKLRLSVCFLRDLRSRLVICTALTRLLCTCWHALCKVEIDICEILTFEMKDDASEKENRSMKIVLLRFEFCAYRNSFPLIIRVLCDVRSGVPQRG